MNEKLVEAQDIILGRISQVCRKLGLNNIMVQLYLILYMNDESMSLNEMAEHLKISKASVSVTIRALERYGAVSRVWVKGSRKDYYKAKMDIIEVMMARVKSITQDRLLEIENMIDSSYETLKGINCFKKEEQVSIEAFRRKLDILRSLSNKAQSLFDLFNSEFLVNMLNAKIKQIGAKEPSSYGAKE